MTGTGNPSSNGSTDLLALQDLRAQLDVLGMVLGEHPRHPTIFRLSRVINHRRRFAKFDTVERAIRDLVGVGLLRCHGASIWLRRPGPFFPG